MNDLHQDDQDLLRGVLEHQQAAVTRFVERFEPLLRRRLRYLSRARTSWISEDDLVQEVFLELLRGDMSALRAWDPRLGRSLGSFLSWFACRRALSVLRKQRGAQAEVSMDRTALARCAATAHGDLARSLEDRQHVQRLLASLSPADHRLVSLLYLDEASVPEVCQRLATSSQNLYKRSHRLRARLRKLMAASA